MSNSQLKTAAEQKTIKPWEYVSDHSRHDEVNKYLQDIIGENFSNIAGGGARRPISRRYTTSLFSLCLKHCSGVI